MTKHHTDSVDNLDIIEESLREDANRLLTHFALATPASAAEVRPEQRSPRFAAQAGLLTSGGLLIAASALLMVHSVHPSSRTDTDNGPGHAGVAMATAPQRPDDVWSMSMDPAHGQGAIVFQLVDEDGAPAGLGIYYPAQQVPIDFSQLSTSEQEAALRLIGEDPEEVMTTSI